MAQEVDILRIIKEDILRLMGEAKMEIPHYRIDTNHTEELL